eukprot:8263769-Pyramimonas_sp.AAC.1
MPSSIGSTASHRATTSAHLCASATRDATTASKARWLRCEARCRRRKCALRRAKRAALAIRPRLADTLGGKEMRVLYDVQYEYDVLNDCTTYYTYYTTYFT